MPGPLVLARISRSPARCTLALRIMPRAPITACGDKAATTPGEKAVAGRNRKAPTALTPEPSERSVP